MCGIWSSILSFQWPSSFPHCLEEGLVLPGRSLSSTLARTHETLSSSHYIGLALFLAFDWMPDFVIDAASMTPRSICFLFWCYHYHGAPVSYVCFIINQPTLSLAFVSLQIPRSSASWVDLVFSCYTHVYASVQSRDSLRRLEEDAGYPVRFLPSSFETVSLAEPELA